MKVELCCCEWVLFNELSIKEIKQKDIALTYRMAMESSEAVDWEKVNKAIINRWSFSGLKRVKHMAWKGIF